MKRSSWTVFGPAFTRLCSRRTPDVRAVPVPGAHGITSESRATAGFLGFLGQPAEGSQLGSRLGSRVKGHPSHEPAFMDMAAGDKAERRPAAHARATLRAGTEAAPGPAGASLRPACSRPGLHLRSRKNRRQQQQLRSRPPQARASRPEAARCRVGAQYRTF